MKNKLVKSFEIIEDNEHLTSNALLAERVEDEENWNSDVPIFQWHYICDLHLMHKIQKLKRKSEQNIKQLIDEIIGEMLPDHPRYMLIGGDVSSDYDVFELFVKQLREEMQKRLCWTDVYFILGNHDLWSFPDKKYDEVVEIYDKLLSEHGMCLLEKELVYYEKDGCLAHRHFLTEEEILNADIGELREKTRKASMFLLGGMAFSGKNEVFNANNGIYGGVINREQEINESDRFHKLYSKVKESFYDKQMIVFTHMPIADWAEKEEYHPGFVYVSGHTHKNVFWDDGEKRIFADNQVGYAEQHFRMKSFRFVNEYDYFAEYADGIYDITVDDYINFYRGVNRMAKCNREHRHLWMLKKNGYYCFIMENYAGNLYMMNGGHIKKLDRWNVKYYYENMDLVIARLREPIEKFNRILKKVSADIRRCGGDGRIHGCIVDISFFEHVYVNPFDLKITAYYAESVVEKWIYPSVPALLYDKRPQLYERYRDLIADNSNNLPTIAGDPNADLSVAPVYVPDTEMYRVSNEILKMQRLDSKVLNTWNEGRSLTLGIEKR